MNNEPNQALEIIHDKPQELMRKATDVAGICKEIVLKTAVAIQGRKYVKCEGWMSIATAHGCIASSRDVVKVDGGWKAVGEIRRISDGVLLAQAEGFVGTDETNTWAKRPEYACRAMAQTRAISRACRAAFAHVVVLMDAGLSTTPAEEVPEHGFDAPAPQQTVQVVVEKPKEYPKHATKVTRAAMMEWLMANGVTEQDILAYGIDKATLMPNESLADWPLEKVGTSKHEWAMLLGQIKQWRDGDLATPSQPESESEPQPQSENRIRGTIQVVSEKPGTAKKSGKAYTKYGVKIADGWLNTFDAKIAQTCKEAKANNWAVDIEYKETDFGREIVSCVAIQTEPELMP